jgi:hypothetical protein
MATDGAFGAFRRPPVQQATLQSCVKRQLLSGLQLSESARTASATKRAGR